MSYKMLKLRYSLNRICIEKNDIQTAFESVKKHWRRMEFLFDDKNNISLIECKAEQNSKKIDTLLGLLDVHLNSIDEAIVCVNELSKEGEGD